MLAQAAPAENYILDERISPARQAAYLQHSGFDAAAPGTVADWFQEHKSYTVANLARAAESVTFVDENRPAWLTLEPDWDVVRIETLEPAVAGLVAGSGDAGHVDVGTGKEETLLFLVCSWLE